MKTNNKNILLSSIVFCMTIIGLQGMNQQPTLQQIIQNNQSPNLAITYRILDNNDITYLVNFLQSDDGAHITSLDLSYNNISNQKAIAISNVLPKTSITSLNLSYNNIGNQGTIAISKVLPRTLITSLDLMYNNIGPEGAIAIANALPKTSITALNLRRNHIGDEGTIAIAEALPNTSITILDLSRNNIGNQGAQAIVANLPNSSVINLNILGNFEISRELRDQLKQFGAIIH